MARQSNSGFLSKLFGKPVPHAAACLEYSALHGLLQAQTPGQAVQGAADGLGADLGLLFRAAPDDGALTLDETTRLPAAGAEIVRRGRELAMQAVQAQGVLQAAPWLAIPLRRGTRLWGAAVFTFSGLIPEPDAPEYFTELGGWLAVVMDYASLSASLQHETDLRQQAEVRLDALCADGCDRERELALLTAVVEAINRNAESRPVLETLCHELVKYFGVTQSAAALLDESGETLHIVAEYVPPERSASLGWEIPVQNNPASLYVIRMKAPLAVYDAQHDVLLAPIYEIMRQRGVASLLILPLLVGERVLGTIGVDAAQPREYHDAEIAVAQRVTALVARLIENAS
jgi:hypothetical protein